jgi:type III secretion system-like peptide-binding chaperone
MSELMWIKSHVELLLQREWDLCRVVSDDDGDFPFRHDTAACYVSVLDTEPVMVRVFGHAAYGLSPSLKVLRELNEIERRSLTARVELRNDVVVVSQTLSPIGLTQPVLAQALDAVATLAADVGLLLAGMFDGRTPFPAAVPDSEDAT